ncbi:MAG: DUF58 domain-containing protein [Candidatus Njordarchaeota archaeon]
MEIKISNVAGVYILIALFGFFLSLSLYRIEYWASVFLAVGIDITPYFPHMAEIAIFAPWLSIVAGILVFAFSFAYLRFSFISRSVVPRIEIKREVSKDKIFQGELTSVKLVIYNPTSFNLDRVTITDLVPDAFDIVFGENYVETNLPAGGRIEISYILRAASRGVHIIGPVNIAFLDNLSMFESEIEIPSFSEIRVFPAYGDVRKIEVTQKALGGFLPGHHTMFKVKGSGYDFHQLRLYNPSDPLRLIDWKASVRLGKLMVKEYHGEKVIKVYILIDTSYTMGFGYRRFTKLDYAARAGALVAYLAQRLQDFFGVLLFSSTVHNFLKAGRGRGHFMRVLSVLAEAEPEGVTNLPGAVRYLIDHEPRSGFLVLITDLEGDVHTFEEGVKIALAHKLRPTIIALLSPLFEIPVSGGPLSEVYKEAVTIEFMRRFRIVSNRIAKYGVRIIPATPRNMLSAVLDAYVKAKMRMIGAI